MKTVEKSSISNDVYIITPLVYSRKLDIGQVLFRVFLKAKMQLRIIILNEANSQPSSLNKLRKQEVLNDWPFVLLPQDPRGEAKLFPPGQSLSVLLFKYAPNSKIE